MSTWYEDYFADVDAMRMEPWLERHTDDAVVKFANNPPAVGKEQIRAAIGGLWDSINGLRHEFRIVHEDGPDAVVLESTTHYERQDGSTVAIPVASALQRNADGLVQRLTIYMDLLPLFDPSASENPTEGLAPATA
jgi:ketosteroid isomerase-like protein